jgi:hypothetical protein
MSPPSADFQAQGACGASSAFVFGPRRSGVLPWISASSGGGEGGASRVAILLRRDEREACAGRKSFRSSGTVEHSRLPAPLAEREGCFAAPCRVELNVWKVLPLKLSRRFACRRKPSAHRYSRDRCFTGSSVASMSRALPQVWTGLSNESNQRLNRGFLLAPSEGGEAEEGLPAFSFSALSR